MGPAGRARTANRFGVCEVSKDVVEIYHSHTDGLMGLFHTAILMTGRFLQGLGAMPQPLLILGAIAIPLLVGGSAWAGARKCESDERAAADARLIEINNSKTLKARLKRLHAPGPRVRRREVSRRLSGTPTRARSTGGRCSAAT